MTDNQDLTDHTPMMRWHF